MEMMTIAKFIARDCDVANLLRKTSLEVVIFEYGYLSYGNIKTPSERLRS